MKVTGHLPGPKKDLSRDQNDGHLSGPFIEFSVKLYIKSMKDIISYKLLFVASKNIVPSPKYCQFTLFSYSLSRDQKDGHLLRPFLELNVK